MTQPLWPVQCSESRAASFSERYGSPALPKILSTKSKLLTRLPGAKKRISIFFSDLYPARPEQTMGGRKSDSHFPACSGCPAENGSCKKSRGGFNARRNIAAKVC